MAVNVGVEPPDFLSLAGQVRVLVGDTDPIELDPPEAGLAEYAWFSDDELEALGLLFGDNPKRVAVWVLSQVAISDALKLKKWTSEDLAVDGPAIAKGIEGTLARLSKEIDDEIAAGGDAEFFGFYGNDNVDWLTSDLRTPYPLNLPWDWSRV